MRNFILLIFFLIAIAAAGQGARTVNINPTENNYWKGKEFYDDDKYTEAIPLLEQVVSASPDDQNAIYYLGLSYRYENRFEEAIAQLRKLEALNPDYWAGFYYQLGICYSNIMQYESAADSFEKFLKKFPEEPVRTRLIHEARYKLNYARRQRDLSALKPVMKEPTRLSDNVNSPYPDYMPALDPTGAKLYFTSKRLGGINEEVPAAKEGDEDIYFIEKLQGAWSIPKLLPAPVNSSSNEGAACFSADGQVMIYTGCGREGGVGSCDLYSSVLEGNHWTTPVNMGNVVNSDEWDSQPSISSDGNRIIFSSARAGGYGAEDLYMIERNIFGEWGPAMNLGGIVNTPFGDNAPFLAQDGKTLYFASKGHPGYGGYDLFKAVYENGKWTMPVNLGKPLNTEGDDSYFTIGGSGETGYFSSTRQGGNQEDLYEIEIPEGMRPQPTVVVEGIVTNLKDGSLVGAYVMVEDLNTGELIAVNKSNSLSGKYLVVLPAGKSYSVSANKEGFFFHSERFDVPVSSRFEEIKKDIGLKPIEKGAKVVLNNIFFETGKAILSDQSRVELLKGIDLMKKNPSMIIEVGGHTDNVGDDALNMKLSHDRAKSVRDYLIAGGIAAARVQAKGYGELNPIATNDTDDGRKANRRTEFVILEF